ncbi:hypothetical protein GCM10009642_32450 [Nocardiopsis metallicus]
MLGPLAVWTCRGEPVRIPGVKVRALLLALLVHEGHPVSVDRLVEALWGGRPPQRTAGALQAKVSQLRGALDRAEPGGRALVEHGPAGYRLVLDAAEVDADRMRDLLERARNLTEPHSRAELLREALGLWRGPAYADAAEDAYARHAAARLEELRLTVVEELARARLELGEHRLLAGELGDLVERNPLREGLRATHMLALYRSGRQSEALDSYERLRVRLAGELGLDPGSELADLHRSLLARDTSLDAPASVYAPVARRVGNLPEPLSAQADGGLIGRGAQIARVRDLLAAERLVTLVGPGGVGKTRLAVEALRGDLRPLPRRDVDDRARRPHRVRSRVGRGGRRDGGGGTGSAGGLTGARASGGGDGRGRRTALYRPARPARAAAVRHLRAPAGSRRASVRGAAGLRARGPCPGNQPRAVGDR